MTEPDAVDGYADPAYEGEELEADGNTSIKTGGTITNTQLIKINVVKEWDDNNNRDGSRNNATIEVTLTQNGDTYGTVKTLSELQEGDEIGSKSADGNTWTWESVWVEVPYADEGGNPYEYAAEETDMPDGYKATPDASEVLTDWEDDETLVFTVANTYEPKKVSITAEKLWNDLSDQDGKRADNAAAFQLYKQVGMGEPEPVGDPVDVTTWARPTNEGEVHTWDDLFAFEDGERITYSVVEVTDGLADGYTLDGYEGGDGEDGNKVVYNDDDATDGVMRATIKATNSYTPQVASVKVIKAWDDANNQDGTRPETLTFTLTGKYTPAGGAEKTFTIPTTSGNAAQDYTTDNTADGTAIDVASWSDLPICQEGAKVTYTITETTTDTAKPPDGVYTTTYDANGFELDATNTADEPKTVTVTNTYTPKTVDISIDKVWNDSNDQDGKRANNDGAIVTLQKKTTGDW